VRVLPSDEVKRRLLAARGLEDKPISGRQRTGLKKAIKAAGARHLRAGEVLQSEKAAEITLGARQVAILRAQTMAEFESLAEMFGMTFSEVYQEHRRLMRDVYRI
jgi:hypothetical protein